MKDQIRIISWVRDDSCRWIRAELVELSKALGDSTDFDRDVLIIERRNFLRHKLAQMGRMSWSPRIK